MAGTWCRGHVKLSANDLAGLSIVGGVLEISICEGLALYGRRHGRSVLQYSVASLHIVYVHALRITRGRTCGMDLRQRRACRTG